MTGVAHIPHLEKRRAGFFYRRRIPSSLRPSNLDPGSYLCLSLRTHVPADAKVLAARLTALCDLAFAKAAERDMHHLGENEIRLLEELARFEIEAFAATRAVALPRSELEAEIATERERLLQDKLRRALATDDREIAKDPLRNMARRLGLQLDETGTSWRALAYEATRVLLDLSKERERNHKGIYETPTAIFTSVRAETARRAGPSAVAPAAVSFSERAQDDQLASAPVAAVLSAAPDPAPASCTTPAPAFLQPAHHRAAAECSVDPRDPAPSPARPIQEEPPQAGPETAVLSPEAADPIAMPVPASSDGEIASDAPCSAESALPDQAREPSDARRFSAAGWTGLDEETAFRVKMRPPLLENINLSDLSEASRKALEKPRGITLIEGIDLFWDLKCAGYGDDFSKEQEAHADAGKKWQKDSLSKLRFARQFWPEFLGNGPVEDTPKEDVRDALAFLPRLPKKHGKGQSTFLANNGYRELVERMDSEEETDTAANLRKLKRRSFVTEADREDARLKALQPRLRSETQVKHRRTLLAIGKMLFDLQLADKNPFELCSVSNSDKKKMSANEATRARTVWDDRIYTFFESPVFQGEIDDPGEPLFWMPLLARLMGLREEEAAQLAPDDF